MKVELDGKQAKQIAQMLCKDIKEYVQNHQEEFEAFIKELERGEKSANKKSRGK